MMDLIIFNGPTYICNGSTYISYFFTPRTTSYNLRNSKFKVRQPSYNTSYLHNYLVISYHIYGPIYKLTLKRQTP